MFVNEGRNKLYIHADLRKKGLIVSPVLALRKAYARNNKSQSSRIKVIDEHVACEVFDRLKITGKYEQHNNSRFSSHLIFISSV
jgi:hypothetical protein